MNPPSAPLAPGITRALRRVQACLEDLYGLELGADVTAFVRPGPEGSHETVFVREVEGQLELAVELPPRIHREGPSSPEPSADESWLEVIEGVSHFVLLAERARTNLPTTLLELELQAEVDKFFVVAMATRPSEMGARSLRHELYRRVLYRHPVNSVEGHRYRLANDLAERFVRKLLAEPLPTRRRATLRQFYAAGQQDKLRLAS